MTAFVQNKGAPKVIYLNEIPGLVVPTDMQSTKFVKISLPTVQEAKNRAIVMALLTVNLRKASHSFVRMFTRSDFRDRAAAQRSLEQIRRYLGETNLVDLDTHTKLVAPSYT